MHLRTNLGAMCNRAQSVLHIHHLIHHRPPSLGTMPHTHTGLLAVVAAVRRRVVVVLVAQGGHGALRLWRERWTQLFSPLLTRSRS